MNKETISDSQGFSIVTLFFLGSIAILGTASEAKNDSWISILIAIVLSIPVIFIYARILSLFPGKDFFDILTVVFGKWIGNFFCIIYTWYFFHLGTLVLRNFGDFMNTLAFPETPSIVSILFINVLCILSAKYGIEVLGRSSKVLLIICVIVLLIIQALSIPQSHFNYIKPILGNGLLPVLKGAFSAFTFPFAESIVFLGVFSSLKKKNSSYKILFSALLIGGVIISIVQIRNIVLIGNNVLSSLYFPSYIAVGRIHIGDFFERMEVTVSIVLVASIFVKISVCLIATCKGISKIFNTKSYKSIVIPTSLLMSYFAYFIFDSTMEMLNFATVVYKFYVIPFQIIIPIITIIFIEINRKKGILKTT